MAVSRADRIQQVIEALNAIGVGEVSAIQLKLRTAADALGGLGMPELQQTVERAGEGLASGDVANFRRLVSQAVARLGHLH